MGVKTCSGDSEANFTDWTSSRFLTNELFFKFTYSLLGDGILVLILNATDLDCDV